MELIWLEDFVVLAATGNFSRAAEARNVTQPAFSRRIRALESHLGVELIDRNGAGLTLAGETLLPGAEEIIRRVRQIAEGVREADRKALATLSFAATHALSFSFFPGWMHALERDGLLGPLRLLSDSMQACETLMLQGAAQFLLCHHHIEAPGRFDPTHFRSLKVGYDILAPYVAPDADGLPRWTLDSSYTAPIPYLAYSAESGLGRILSATILVGKDDRLETVFTSHLAATMLSMARDGRGVCWLPTALVKDDLATGRLLRAASDPAWSTVLDIRVFRPAARQGPAAEAFWSLAQSRAKDASDADV